MSKKTPKKQGHVESQYCSGCGLVQWGQVLMGLHRVCFCLCPQKATSQEAENFSLLSLGPSSCPLELQRRREADWHELGEWVGARKLSRPDPPWGCLLPAARQLCPEQSAWSTSSALASAAGVVTLPAFWNGSWWAVSSKTIPDPTLFSLRVLCILF